MTELVERLNITDLVWLNALIIAAFYIIIAFLIDLFVVKVLVRIAGKTKSDVDDRIIKIGHKPVFFTIILFGLISAIGGFDLPEKYLLNIKRSIHTIVALLWMVTLVRISTLIIRRGISRLSDTTGLSKDLIPLIANVTKIGIIIAGLMVCLAIWHIDITPLWASAGIASVIVALAAKDTIANFFGGISVFMDKPYKVGDYIELDGKERGEVVDIGVRSTRIKTRDDILISIPNATIANSKIVNESAPVPAFRVRIPVQVAYGSDIELVERILNEMATNNPNILEDPEPRVRFRSFGDSGLNFELLCWAIEPAMRGLTIHELNKKIYHKFDELGIVIPFPQRDIHVFNDDRGNTKKENKT